MSTSNLQFDYDFLVTDIGVVIERPANPLWHINNLANQNFYILAFAISGEASYYFNGNNFHIKKGDTLFFPKAFVHSASSDAVNPWSFYSVAFNVEFNNDYTREKFNTLRNYISSPNLFSLPNLFAELNHAWTGKRTGYLIKCRSMIMEILYAIIREVELSGYNSSHAHIIERIANIIQSNYKNTYSINDLSRLSGLSSSHFRLLFKRITGFSVTDYQNHIKINKAKDLLLSRECNVTEAALAIGFNDIYYFSRLFKKVTGVNPSNYLKK